MNYRHLVEGSGRHDAVEREVHGLSDSPERHSRPMPIRWKWDTISRVGSEHLGLLINEYVENHRTSLSTFQPKSDNPEGFVYHLGSPSGMTDAALYQFIHEAQRSPRRVRWDQLQAFELVVIERLTEPRMHWVAEMFEKRYADLAPEVNLPALRHGKELVKLAEPELREYLRCLSVRYFNRRASIADQEMLRVYLLLYASALTVVMCALAAGLYVRYAYFGDQTNPYRLPTFQICVCMGAIGSFVSLQRRLQSLPTSSVSAAALTQLRIGQIPVFLVPILGAIFAGLLFFLVSGGILTGGLFPTMMSGGVGKTAEAAYSYINIDHTVPATVADFYKLLVWCFVAGFAEKLVPDVLDRLAGEAAKNKKDAAPPKKDDKGTS